MAIVNRPTADEIEKLIKDSSVTDEDVLQALKIFTRDKIDEKGELIPPTQDELLETSRLGELTRKLRPRVIERLIQHFLEEHGSCCDPTNPTKDP